MVAVAVLAVSLLALMNLLSRSLVASGRAERILVSTFLGRYKMAEVLLGIEQGLLKGEFPEEVAEDGTFEEQNFPDFFWKLQIKKVELPGLSLPAVGEGQAGSGSGEIMNQALKILGDVLSRSSREVRLTIGWQEMEEEETGLVVVTHVVHPGGPL